MTIAQPPVSPPSDAEERIPRPQPGKPRRRQVWLEVATLLVVAVVATIATWALARTDAEPVAPKAVATPVDVALCADLDRLGRDFYQTYYVPLVRNGGYGSVEYIRLSASTAAVSTVGAPSGQIDGSATIAAASPAISSSMSGLTGEAKLVAQGAASSAIFGGNRVPGVAPLLNQFNRATLECSRVDHAPSWFDPTMMPGR